MSGFLTNVRVWSGRELIQEGTGWEYVPSAGNSIKFDDGEVYLVQKTRFQVGEGGRLREVDITVGQFP